MTSVLDTGLADLREHALQGWSVLYGDHPAPEDPGDLAEPGYFRDLNLDQVLTGVAGTADEYGLSGYLRHPLVDPDVICFRQAVFTDVEQSRLREVIDDFGNRMRTVRDRLGTAKRPSEYYERRRWHLDAATAYCEAVSALHSELADADPSSLGLRGIATYLRGYLDSPRFRALTHARSAAIGALAAVRYVVLLDGARVTVGGYDDEPDYSVQVTDTFARFRNDGTREAEMSVPRHGGALDHVEADVLAQLAKIFPDHFAVLDQFCADHSDFLDPTVLRFDEEIRFYLMFEDYLAQLRSHGLPLTMPVLTQDHRSVRLLDVYDLPLAVQCCSDDRPVVRNDVTLEAPERIVVVSGPNNGGKTTMARTIGQLHHLARLGCPVPGRDVQIALCDEIYTHFERQEDISTLTGRLRNELDRLHRTLDEATDRSVIIMNEMFSSTTVDDAQYLSREILTRVTDLGAIGVCVTFLEELSTLNESTVSMVSLVDPNDAGHRTFQVVRQRADGRAYARALATKYGLTHDQVQERVTV